MRRFFFALAAFALLFSPVPGRAQWWGPGGSRGCDGPCRVWGGGGWGGPVVILRPRRFWAGPGFFGPPRFRPARFGWRRPIPWARPSLWRREMMWRRLAAERDAEDAAARPEPVRIRPSWRPPSRPLMTIRHGASPVAVDRPALRLGWHARARQAETAVAVAPVAALPINRVARPAVVPPSVLASAAALHRLPVPPPAPVTRAVLAVPRRPPVRAALPTARSVAPEKAVLRSEPPASLPVAPPTPQAGGAPADIPAAPLD